VKTVEQTIEKYQELSETIFAELSNSGTAKFNHDALERILEQGITESSLNCKPMHFSLMRTEPKPSLLLLEHVLEEPQFECGHITPVLPMLSQRESGKSLGRLRPLLLSSTRLGSTASPMGMGQQVGTIPLLKQFRKLIIFG
jgi:hypothetical protein